MTATTFWLDGLAAELTQDSAGNGPSLPMWEYSTPGLTTESWQYPATAILITLQVKLILNKQHYMQVIKQEQIHDSNLLDHQYEQLRQSDYFVSSHYNIHKICISRLAEADNTTQ